MPTKNTQNDFQEQAEKIVKKSHNKKVYLIIAIVFIAIILGLLVGIFAVVKNYDSGGYKKPMNNKIVKPVEQEIKNYYDVLEKRCVEEKCCLASLKIMKENNYKKVDQDGKCIDGFEMNTVIWKECPQVLEWCEPIKNEYCLKDGEKRERLKDKCCGESKFYVDGNYISGTKLCVASQYSICLNCGNGICGIGENGCNCPKDCIKENDISNWQTYRNEEFGIKFKYGKKDTEIKIEKNKITATFNKEPYYNFNGEIIVFEKSKDETIEHAIEKIIKEEDINLEDCKIITKKQNMSENSNNINISVLLKEDYEPSDDEVMAEIGYIDSLENLDFICETTPECEWAKQKLLEERTELKCSQYAGCFGYKCLSNFVYQPNNSKQKFIYIKARKGTPSFWKWDSIEILKNEPDTSDWQTYRNEEFGFEFKYPIEYPDGNNVIVKDSNNYMIKILNYECIEKIHGMYCDINRETKNDFFIELFNLNNIKGKNLEFYPEKDLEDYQGVVSFGNNEFYNGFNYGPKSGNIYVLRNDTNIRINFYDNYTDELISGILSAFKFID